MRATDGGNVPLSSITAGRWRSAVARKLTESTAVPQFVVVRGLDLEALAPLRDAVSWTARVESSTALPTPPQATSLPVGAVEPRVGGGAGRCRVGLPVAHRVADGTAAARLLERLARRSGPAPVTRPAISTTPAMVTGRALTYRTTGRWTDRMREGRAAAIVLAGGSGTRVGGERNKVYLPLAGRTVISWSLNAFAGMREIGPVVLVVRAADRALAERVVYREVEHDGVETVTGGASRQESELAGLRHLAPRIGSGEIDAVLIHDGARPLMTRTLAAGVLGAARAVGGAVPGLPRDDLSFADGDTLTAPAPAGLVAVQTPQGFRAAPLLAAYEEAARRGFAGTDTASCMERFAADTPVHWIAGDQRNFKITYAHDLLTAEDVLDRAGHHLG